MKNIIVSILLLQIFVYAKGGGGGGSWGEVTHHNKYGEKKVLHNSKRKSSNFNGSDTCKQFIYIDTYQSFRTRDYISHSLGHLKDGYATTKVSIGNDKKYCQRIPLKVKTLEISQLGESIRARRRLFSRNRSNNVSFLRMNMKRGDSSSKYTTEHLIKFKDNTFVIVEIHQNI